MKYIIDAAAFRNPIQLFFEDMDKHIRIISRPRTVTAEDIDSFAGLSWDVNPLHTDPDYATQTRYGTRIAHGALILAMATGIAYNLGLLSESLEAFTELNWKFRAPVKIGDVIRVRFIFHRKRKLPGYAGGLVSFIVRVINQENKVVQRGMWTMLLRCRPKQLAAEKEKAESEKALVTSETPGD